MSTCTIEDCERQADARGWCSVHYGRWRSHGDPLTVLRDWGKGKTAETVGYDGMHDRVRKARGRASEHQCACGKPAEQWAYDHADPNELRNELTWRQSGVKVNVAYSLDVEHYIPMCRSCHVRFDRGDFGTLTAEQVVEIRLSRDSIHELAERYGVSVTALYRADAGLSWSHVPMPADAVRSRWTQEAS